MKLALAPTPDSQSLTPGLAVVCDLVEENWPSMDLVAAKLIEGINTGDSPLRAERICPSFQRRFTQIPRGANQRALFNADRLLNRMRDYPRYLKRRAEDFDLFHIADHSYAHLVHQVPAERTGVFCHDLDTFRCLLDPAAEPRPLWFRKMSQRILTGMQRAAVVFYTTESVRSQIELHGLVDPARLVKAPYGIGGEFTPDEPLSGSAALLPDAVGDAPFLLHVGSCIPRKRIDLLLEVMARLRPALPELRLVQVGGTFSDDHRALIDRLALGDRVVQLPRQDQHTIAELYRRAALVAMPSESEGFGLPVIEALACGAIVVASDIPVFHEVGSEALVYLPVGDIDAWVAGIKKLITDAPTSPPCEDRLAQARQFSWTNHARIIGGAYEKLN
jgi:glycosyltransferase involved in cell wall biosynthesis